MVPPQALEALAPDGLRSGACFPSGLLANGPPATGFEALGVPVPAEVRYLLVGAARWLRHEERMAVKGLPKTEEPPLANASAARRISSILLGVFVVAALTLGGAYYVPLYRAHRALTAGYEDLSERAQALNAELGDTQAERTAIRGERDTFKQRDADQAARADEFRRGLDKTKVELEKALAKYVDGGFIRIAVAPERVTLDFRATLVQSLHSVDASRTGTTILCEVGKVLARDDRLEVHGYAKERSPSPALGKKYPTTFARSAARAAAAATTLREACGLDGPAVTAIAHGHFAAEPPQADLLGLAIVRQAPGAPARALAAPVKAAPAKEAAPNE